ncbi:MAG: hypothetical protein AB8H47_14465 [Bacteroidia bacterium]
MVSEQQYISHCKQQIVAQLQLGDSTGKLRQRDFSYLADLIEQKSGVNLSLSTLKRLWREDQNSIPHPSTLNALVSVLNIEDWQSFKQSFKAANQPVPKQTPPPISARLIGWFAVIGVIAVLGLLIFIVPGFVQSNRIKINGPISFKADKTVSMGVPNTVIFNYDVSKVQADSFFIQQSWNEAFREAIDPEKTHFTSIYYYPGYHKAKLIANDSIIAVQPIHLLTDGWMPFVITENGQEKPIYLAPDITKRPGELRIVREDLSTRELEFKDLFRVSFRQMRDFGDLSSRNFQLKAQIKADYFPEMPCQKIELLLHCEKHIMLIPLTSKACVSNLGLKLGENYLSGREHDFSAFGVDDLEAWHELALIVREQQAEVLLDGKSIYETTYEQDLGLIKGLDIRFEGLGQADWIRLWDGEGELVFEDEFE